MEETSITIIIKDKKYVYNKWIWHGAWWLVYFLGVINGLLICKFAKLF